MHFNVRLGLGAVMSDKDIEREQQETRERQSYLLARESFSRGFGEGVSWGYLIGVMVGAAVCYAIMKEPATWLR